MIYGWWVTPWLRAVISGTVLLGCLLLGGRSSAEGAIRAHAARKCELRFQSTRQTACWRPFSPRSPFNHALPARPRLAADNAVVRHHMATYHWALQASSSTSWRSFTLSVPEVGTRAVYFASPSDPLAVIHCNTWYGANTCQGVNGVNINGAVIHVPAGAQPTHNWDGHMAIVETDTGLEYDLWGTSVAGQTITSGTGAVENVNTSDGINDAGDAAGFALTAGLLRPAELAAGRIDHALVISIPCTNDYGAEVGYSWPASAGWGEPCGQYVPEDRTTAPTLGQLFKLRMSNAQIAASRAPRWEKTIMRALAHYGAYAEDTNGGSSTGMDILLQDEASWTNIGQRNQWARTVRKLGGHDGWLSSRVPIPTRKLEVVAPCVPRHSCSRPHKRHHAHKVRHARRSHARA